MEVFPPTSSFKRDEFRDQITGEQKFEYILIPRQSGSYTINPITLTYFDPDFTFWFVSEHGEPTFS